jgi:hypothetical protein
MTRLKLMTKDIHDIRTWPPGTFILYDNRKHVAGWKKFLSTSEAVEHVGIGIVVANDGINTIRVVWGANCEKPYLEYNVTSLNASVIRHAE